MRFPRSPRELGWERALELIEFERLLARYLRRRRWRVLFSPKPDWEPSIRLGFCDTPHAITFAPLSADAVRQHELVVPLTFEALERLQALRTRDDLRQRLRDNAIPIPKREAVARCDDKLRCAETLAAMGFGEHVPRIGEALPLPYVLKKRRGEFGLDVHVIANAAQERALAHRLADPDYFRQQLVPGALEYATHILFRDDRVVCALNVEYAFDSQAAIKGQQEPLHLALCDCPYLDLFASMLRGLGFDGLCCVNYKVAAGRAQILEVNPRFGASLAPFFCSFLRHLG